MNKNILAMYIDIKPYVKPGHAKDQLRNAYGISERCRKFSMESILEDTELALIKHNDNVKAKAYDPKIKYRKMGPNEILTSLKAIRPMLTSMEAACLTEESSAYFMRKIAESLKISVIVIALFVLSLYSLSLLLDSGVMLLCAIGVMCIGGIIGLSLACMIHRKYLMCKKALRIFQRDFIISLN